MNETGFVCPLCGHPVELNASKCGGCGVEFATDDEEETQEEQFVEEVVEEEEEEELEWGEWDEEEEAVEESAEPEPPVQEPPIEQPPVQAAPGSDAMVTQIPTADTTVPETPAAPHQNIAGDQIGEFEMSESDVEYDGADFVQGENVIGGIVDSSFRSTMTDAERTRIQNIEQAGKAKEARLKEEMRKLTEEVQPSWNYPVDTNILHVGMSTSGKEIVCSAGYSVYFFNDEGKLLWRRDTGGAIDSLGISADGKYVVASSKDQNIYCYRNDSNPLWKYGIKVPVTGASVSGAGKTIIAANPPDALQKPPGEPRGFIYLISTEGTVLWHKGTRGQVTSVTISNDGKYVMAGDDSHRLYVYNDTGELQWTYDTGNMTPTYLDSSARGDFLLMGGDENLINIFDKNRTLIWEYESKLPLQSLAISGTGRYICMAYGGNAFFFDNEGNQIWTYQTGTFDKVATNGTGLYTVNGYQNYLYLYDNVSRVTTIIEIAEKYLEEAQRLGAFTEIAEENLADAKEALEKKLFGAAYLLGQDARFEAEDAALNVEQAKDSITSVKVAIDQYATWMDVTEPMRMYNDLKELEAKKGFKSIRKNAEDIKRRLGELAEVAKPVLPIEVVPKGNLVENEWIPFEYQVKNVGHCHAEQVSVEVRGEVFSGDPTIIPKLKVGEEVTIPAYLRFDNFGEQTVNFDINSTAPNGSPYTTNIELVFNIIKDDLRTDRKKKKHSMEVSQSAGIITTVDVKKKGNKYFYTINITNKETYPLSNVSVAPFVPKDEFMSDSQLPDFAIDAQEKAGGTIKPGGKKSIKFKIIPIDTNDIQLAGRVQYDSPEENAKEHVVNTVNLRDAD